MKVQIEQADILQFDPRTMSKYFNGAPYKLVANIPYNITSHFLRQFLELDYRPTRLVLLVQKEVAERIVAPPGAKSLLSLSVEYYSTPRIVAEVPRECFFPRPAVDSAIIELAVKPGIKVADSVRFFQVAKIGFSARRKQLQNNLANGLHRPNEEIKEIFNKLGLKENVRAQELSLADWQRLVIEVSK
jgi:16S rRNA (adenine1518-N6/adenine1519-N6)-dimethyltransferase